MNTYKPFDFFLTASENDLILYLLEVGIIWPRNCLSCNEVMRLSKDKKHFTCRRRNGMLKCSSKISIFYGTIFSKKKITLKQIFYIFNEFRKNVIHEIVAIDIDINISTVQHWYAVFRNVLVSKVRNEMPISIGGAGRVVEFDETLLVKRKYNVGRVLAGQKWVVVGVERGCRERFFIDFVARRNRRTLLPLIMSRILPGTTIMTDNWGAYRRLSRYTSIMGYSHYIVNHVDNFIDPVTGANTQTVEGVNSVVKRLLRKSGTNLGNVEKRIDKIIELRYKVFKRRILFNYLFEALVEYCAFN